MAQRQTLPVLPLRGTVIFPGLTQPIAAGRPSTLRAIEAALKGDRLVFAVAQRDNTEEPTADILYSMRASVRSSEGWAEYSFFCRASSVRPPFSILWRTAT